MTVLTDVCLCVFVCGLTHLPVLLTAPRWPVTRGFVFITTTPAHPTR